MKITALGVNSAFATGTYKEAIPVARVRELFKTASLKDTSEEQLEAEIAKWSEQLYQPCWQSNFLLEFDMASKRNGKPPYRLLLDLGGDARHALKALGMTSADIDGVYVSHPHNDHIGGMEWIGLTTFFNPFYTKAKKEWLGEQFIADKLSQKEWQDTPPPSNTKPDIFIHKKVLEPLRRAVGPGLDTVQGVPDVTLETYFNIHTIGKQLTGETRTHTFLDGDGKWKIKPIFAMHVISSSEEMASYGLNLEHPSGYTVLMPTDTQHMLPPQLETLYKRADRVYMDCETSPFPSKVHPHISDLINHMDPEVQKKCLLYHYDAEPDVPEGMFYGILRPGDSHIYPAPAD